jgi:phosphoglycerate dehydrogenase-like enzyme
MRPELRGGFFGSPEWARLEAVAGIVSREAFADFDSREGAAALSQAEILLAAWGAPALTAERLARAPNLRMVAYTAASIRAMTTPAFWERGILITSAVSAMAVPVAEFTFAAIVMCGKDVFRLRDAHRLARGQGGFGTRMSLDTLHLGNYRRRVGIVGASRTGRLVIDLLVHAGFEVSVYDPFIDAAGAQAMGAVNMELADLLASSDTVSLHAPILPETRHMIGAAELALMPDNAILINTARGWLVDHAALERELVSGRLSALIDTPDPEPLPPESVLYDLPNVILTPHIAGAQGNELRRLSDLAITEIERYVAGLPPLHPVTAAELDRIA